MQFLRRNIFGVLRSTLSLYRNNLINKFGFLQKFKKLKTGAILLSITWLGSEPSRFAESPPPSLIPTSDELFQQSKYRDICNLLKNYKDCSDVEILWRLARAQYNLSQEIATSGEEKKKLIFEAFGIISKSLALDENHFANHKWMSILLDARSTYDGIKARISHLQSVKEHMVKASSLNPNDATTLYMLGVWCYQIADMPWYQRKIASTIFAAPPESSYEEALVYFEKAENIDPKFYSQNLLMLGKTYLMLKNIEKAKYYLTMACEYPIANDDDFQATKEACDILQKLKKK